MRRLVVGMTAGVALGLLLPGSGRAVEVDSKAEKITITGWILPEWTTSSIKDGNPANEFRVRNARMALKLKINSWVSGMIEPDFGEFNATLADCYFRAEPSDHVGLLLGQTKRRFDLFELVADTQSLVIERDGRIGRTAIQSYSHLTEDLQYADRDLGAFVLTEVADERVLLEGAITNGAGVDTPAQVGEKAFSARVSVEPMKDEPLAFNVAFSTHPFPQNPTVNDNVGNGVAFEISGEYGRWKSGPHIQAGFVTGDNWRLYSVANDKSPNFTAFQAIATYKGLFANPKWFEAWEPLVRFSWADPNGDVSKDGGTLLTPGINLYIVGRTRLSADADVYMPQADDNPLTQRDESATALGFKFASWLYF